MHAELAKSRYKGYKLRGPRVCGGGGGGGGVANKWVGSIYIHSVLHTELQ